MKNFLLFSFVAILLMGCDEDSENLPAPNYSIDGKWTFEDNSLNTMYLYEDGVRTRIIVWQKIVLLCTIRMKQMMEIIFQKLLIIALKTIS